MCCHYTMWRWVTMVHTTRATCGGRDRWGSCADVSTDQVAAPALVCELLCGVRRTFLAHAAGPTALHCNTTPRGTASTPAAVAQIGRASGCNPEGHRFNPCSLLPLFCQTITTPLVLAKPAPGHTTSKENDGVRFVAGGRDDVVEHGEFIHLSGCSCCLSLAT